MTIYHDVTLTLEEDMVTYPGDPKFYSQKYCSIEKDGYNLRKLTMGSHNGTHIDAPKHYFSQGNAVDNIPMSKLIGNCKVFYIEESMIDYDTVKALPISKGDKIIFKTCNSSYWKDKIFHSDFVALTQEAARFLCEKDIDLVGIDYVSIEGFYSKDATVHKLFLSKDIPILEGLDLSSIDEGTYHIIIMPLKIKDGDGAPARVVIVEK